ncbi:MAG: U32 family peptidase [Rhodospirillales bacterium]|nr:U32 family peptidase [Rhodospirillales bacterium]
MKTSKLTLGPNLFNWKAETWRDFYFRMADEAPVDSVYLGEVVCSKRSPFYAQYIPDIIERLEAAGKEVILSTLALIMTKREMESVREIAEAEGYMVEANDISAAALLEGRPHAIGPFINVYNEGTLAYLTRKGATRITLPVELESKSIEALAKSTSAELEVQIYGRLPLAISARCYHARTHQLSKDNCQFVCDRDPDGLDLDTLDGEPFLAVNGVQTMSYTYCNLSAEMEAMAKMGVSHFRLSPHSGDMVKIAQAYRDLLDGKSGIAETEDIISEQSDDMPFSNGYFYGKEGVVTEGERAELGE